MFVSASPGTLAPFPVHGMPCILNPVRGHSCPLLGQLQAPTNFVNGRSRSPPLFFPSAAFNPARAPLYCVQSKEGGETGPGEGDLASPALSWQGSSTPPVRDLPRPDDHHQTTRRPGEDHQTTRSPPDYLNNFPKPASWASSLWNSGQYEDKACS